MIIDARTLPIYEVVETDVCVVGTGPAGLAIAHELAGQNFRLCFLESGGFEEPDAAAQALSQGKTAPRYPDLEITFNRRLGGTAHRWHIRVAPGEMGARFIPFNEVDFDQRPEIPYSGWPFNRADLDPFYERAQPICKLGPYTYNPSDWVTPETPELSFKSDRLQTTICQFTRLKRFIPENLDILRQAENITTYINATVLEIETDDTASTVTTLRVASGVGHEFRVRAKLFILATGGIETPRLLLLSNRVQTNGLGNQHDLVGRFFMDHPCYLGGLWFPANKDLFNQTALYDIRRVNGTPIVGRLVLQEDVVRREKMMNVFGFLHPRTAGYRSQPVQSLRTLMQSLRKGQLPKNTAHHLTTVLGNLGEIVSVAWKRLRQPKVDLTPADKGGWSEIPHKDQIFECFELFLSAEQVPDPNNRVTLMAERDPLGRPCAQLHWDWKHPIDIHTIKRAQEIFKEEIEKAGLGRLDIMRDDHDLPYMTASSAHHLMGTTRMHPDPQQGVVDEQCRVHGVANLFIASSAVFPTGGQVNPTLTIVAMAVRLADHIKQVMASQLVTSGKEN
jgi:choline dehydrogenase-like flavoprotein